MTADRQNTASQERAPGGSLLTVLVALGANFLVAAAKTIAAVLTGWAAMVAEPAHSWADTGNEVFLLVAERRSARPRDRNHPRGYGREGYVWSMFAARARRLTSRAGQQTVYSIGGQQASHRTHHLTARIEPETILSRRMSGSGHTPLRRLYSS